MECSWLDWGDFFVEWHLSEETSPGILTDGCIRCERQDKHAHLLMRWDEQTTTRAGDELRGIDQRFVGNLLVGKLQETVPTRHAAGEFLTHDVADDQWRQRDEFLTHVPDLFWREFAAAGPVLRVVPGGLTDEDLRGRREG